MEILKKKCSLNKHSEIDAISYCQECKRYFCNKCKNFHSEILQDHQIINLDKEKEIFIDMCKENNHANKLEFFCKDHNTLCCVLCTSKMKDKGYGQHFDCHVCDINDIKDEKRNQLKENINNLEGLYNQTEKSIQKLKIIYEEIDKNKEELKLKIQSIFTKIRNTLNEKEDKLLNEIDEYYDNIYFKEDIIKKSEKLPIKIKKSIEEGKIIDKEWNEKNLSSLIYGCINIENNIKDLNKINNNIKKYELDKDYKIEYNIEEEQINNLNDKINGLGKIITKDSDLYEDYKIENKNPLHILNYHENIVSCLCILKDGRLVSGSFDDSIIIYNKITYQPDLIIKEHNDTIFCITVLSSGILASCSGDKTIKLFKINERNYEVLQTLNYHNDSVYKIIELKNQNLASCSTDSSVIFYIKDNNNYKKDYQIPTDGKCCSLIQTKDNEICYSQYNNSKICFHDLNERKLKSSISNVIKKNTNREWFIMIKKDLLLIPGENQMSIINVNQYKIVKVIEIPNSNWICGVCLLNKNMLLTGDCKKVIRQWKIEGDNLIMISKKEKVHEDEINFLINIGNGFIASCSSDHNIKIW